MKRVVILVHEPQPPGWRKAYLIDALRESWTALGVGVSYARGIRERPEADLLIPHVDLTRTPEEYLEFIGAYPRVLNRQVVDIAKRTTSQNLLDEGSDYEGPVIVKTNNNSGGAPERWTAAHRYPLVSRIGPRVCRLLERVRGPDLAKARALGRYPVFASLSELPPGVFHNRALVVERFLPEREGQWYFLRHYLFLGTHTRHVRVAGKGPFLKRAECVPVEDNLPVPEDLLELRRRLGFDYGKFDYTVHDGRVVVLDLNRTPANPGTAAATAVTVGALSDGIHAFLAGSQ